MQCSFCKLRSNYKLQSIKEHGVIELIQYHYELSDPHALHSRSSLVWVLHDGTLVFVSMTAQSSAPVGVSDMHIDEPTESVVDGWHECGDSSHLSTRPLSTSKI